MNRGLRAVMSDAPPVLFVAGTGQHSGKTMISLGVVMAMRESGLDVRYMKPVGQRTVKMGDKVVDEDVALLLEVCELDIAPETASPVTLPPGFTRRFLMGEEGDTWALRQRIVACFEEVSRGGDIVIVEGTGHAGVGSVVGLCNASVARLLGAEVVLVTGGGIGRPIDEFNLNEALFARRGVAISGVVCNKVLAGKLDDVREPVGRWMDAHGVKLLGLIPYDAMLTRITVEQIVHEMGADVITGRENLGCHIRKVVVGAEPAHRFLKYYGPGVMGLIPGDRDDLVLAAISAQEVGAAEDTTGASTAAMCLTSGILPHENIMAILRRTRIPVITVKEGMYDAASRISDLVAKMTSSEAEKVVRAHALVTKHLDLNSLQKRLGLD